MLDNFTWQILHILSIFAHIGLFFAGFIALVTEGFSPGNGSSESYLVLVLPWAACATAMVGAAVNSNLFTYMRRLQKPRDESNQDRGLKIKFALGASMFVNVPLIAADFTIAAVTATKIRDGGGVLAAPVTLAAIAGFMALGTSIADMIHLRGLDAQTYPNENIVPMPPSQTNESVYAGHPGGGR